MQRTTYEFVEVSNGHSLPSPIILRQNNRKFARLPGLLLMTGLIVAPQIALAAYAFGSPEVRASLIAHPWATLETRCCALLLGGSGLLAGAQHVVGPDLPSLRRNPRWRSASH